MADLAQDIWKEKAVMTDGAVIIDVRTPQEWDEGIIAGAKKLDIMDTQNFVSELEKMDKNTPYFMYCRSGNRSGQACQLMEQMGFNEAYNLVGGILEWEGKLV